MYTFMRKVCVPTFISEGDYISLSNFYKFVYKYQINRTPSHILEFREGCRWHLSFAAFKFHKQLHISHLYYTPIIVPTNSPTPYLPFILDLLKNKVYNLNIYNGKKKI